MTTAAIVLGALYGLVVVGAHLAVKDWRKR